MNAILRKLLYWSPWTTLIMTLVYLIQVLSTSSVLNYQDWNSWIMVSGNVNLLLWGAGIGSIAMTCEVIKAMHAQRHAWINIFVNAGALIGVLVLWLMKLLDPIFPPPFIISIFFLQVLCFIPSVIGIVSVLGRNVGSLSVGPATDC